MSSISLMPVSNIRGKVKCCREERHHHGINIHSIDCFTANSKYIHSSFSFEVAVDDNEEDDDTADKCIIGTDENNKGRGSSVVAGSSFGCCGGWYNC